MQTYIEIGGQFWERSRRNSMGRTGKQSERILSTYATSDCRL